MPKNRRGISSVVGALFFTVLMVAGFSVLSLALDAQTDIVTTQRVISDIELKKQQERFGIAVSTDANNYLDISVTNLGQNPVGISSFWIINKTLADAPATRYEIDYDQSFVTGGATSQILTSQTLTMIPDTYDIKVVSTLGTIEIAELEVGLGGSSSNSLQSVLLSNPPDIILGQNVTLAMVVTNVGKLTIKDVTPVTPSITPSASILTPLPSNPQPVDLLSGESIVFVWDYQTNDASAIDSTIDFSIFATGVDVNNNPVQSNIAIDTSILREDATDSSSTEPPIVLTQDLLSRPEIFMVIPSPMGDGSSSTDKALWGVNIVNPTGQDMYVNKVVVSLLSPRSQNNDVMFSISGTHQCAPVAVSPTPDNWDCPATNQLEWADLANPVQIPPYSVFPFQAMVHPDKLSSGSVSLSSVIVHGTVFTTVGQFGKAGYGTSFDNGATSMAGVFLSTSVDSANPSDIISNVTGISSGSVVKFNATLADFEPGTHYIDDNSRLIINIPKGWVVNEPSITSDDFTTNYQSFSDTSSQIIGTLDSDLASGGVTVEFSATAPTVTNDQMYVMYLLADGSVDNGSFTIGPLQEAVLQVIP